MECLTALDSGENLGRMWLRTVTEAWDDKKSRGLTGSRVWRDPSVYEKLET
jgi:hypothetical protein